MKSIQISIISLICLLIVACSETKNIAESTNGIVDTNIKPKIIFTENITNSVNTLYDSNGEIKINGKEFYGKYIFNKNNEITLLPNENLNANTNYKIDLDFKEINKKTNSNINAKKWTIKFKTDELSLDMPNANFIKDSQLLDKIKLDATLEISQEIPLDSIKQNVRLLDSNKNDIQINIFPLDNKKFQIISIPINPPKDKDENYQIIFNKNIGTNKDISIPITAIKNMNLDIIDIKTIYNDNISIEVRFSNILANNANLDNFIRISPNVTFNASQANDIINIKGNFVQNREYTIEILKGIKSQDNLELKENYKKEIKIYDSAPKIVFSNDGVFLPDSANKKIAFRSINVKKANIIIKKIYANNIIQFLGDKDLLKSNTNDYWIYRFELMGDIIKQTSIDIDSPKNVWVQNEIDLSDIKDSSGIFIVHMSFDKDGVDYHFPKGMAEWKQNEYFYSNGNIYKQLIFSNIALIAQKYNDNNEEKIIASALDIRTNQPLSNINIQAISQNNQLISSSLTDKNGNAILEYESENNKAFYISATKQDSNDFTILKLSSQQIPDDGFDTEGVASKNGIKAFIYTDRGVYRPGDKVNLNIIARNINQHIKEAIAHPIKLTIVNPRNKKQIDKLSINPIEDGVYYYEFTTTKNADTGIYNVIVDIGGNTFTHQLAVETIVPNRIKVEINARDKIDINKQKNINFSIQSDYLFGAPADSLEYKIDAHIYPKDFISTIYRDWTFDNPTNLKYIDNEIYTGKLDEKGFAQRTININNINRINKNLEATIIARVFENNGRQVSNRKKVELELFDSFIGIKKPQTKYIKTDEIVNIPVILIDKDEKLIPNRKLKYTIYNNNYSWWWDYDNYNNFIQSIKSDKFTKIIDEGEITTKDEISYIRFQAKDKGEILVEVKDTTNNQSASIFLYASSWGEPLNMDKITQLKIKADKKEYAHNDIAKVTFESVKNGKALITISNNENILDRYWIDTNDFQTTIDVKIDEKYAPNIYANVFLLQDYQHNDNDRSLRLYGVVPLKITNEKTKINLNIQAKDEILPNSDLSIEISNKEKKQVIYTLSIVDEGLININNFKTPSPWDYFYAKTKLGIQNYDTYDYIINKTIGRIEKVYSIGGGEEFIADSINKQKDANADRFKPVVFFVKPTKSDENGYAKINFKVPSYVGSLRVMLVAVDNNSYGSTSKDVRVSAPVVMLPTIPRSLKINDDFKLPIEILPIKDNVKNAKISISSDGIAEFSPKSQNIAFNNKKSKTLFFNGKVKEELGIENINISLESGDFKIQDSTQIDIKAPNPYVLISKNYILDNKSLIIKAPNSYVKNSNLGKITISASPILSIDHRLLWLIRYPYGCVEQTISSVFPQLFIDKLSNADFIDKETIINNINAAIAKISLFQNADGGFSYWQGEGNSDKWGSSYAGHFLIMAKKYGYFVSEEMFKRWLNYEIRNANDTTNIYPIYLLALANNPQLGIMNEIYENHLYTLSVTNRWLLGASYKLAGFDDIAKKITANLSIIPNEDSNYYKHTYGSTLRNKAMILQSYKIINNEINQDLYNSIKDELETNEWLSTQTISYALLVLASIKEDAKNTTLEGKITINNKTQVFNENKDRIIFNLNSGNASIESPNNLFVNYTWEGISTDNKSDNIAKNMRLSREFVKIDSYGNENIINPRELKSTQDFYIKLTLSSIDSPIDMENIALTQNLPSGWEIENTRLNNDPIPNIVELANEDINYVDIRDDKIMWFFDIHKTKTLYVKINAITPGEYTLPPAYAEAMYNGNYQASTDSFRVKVNAK
ncbi:hypothetical protein CCY99_00185 [Helicobacter sp. 16-1353]|uniref:alpha-2-macroglobulin family protein n=1 Tax=Helicobacter sp. 16-1353 TaxID=2004996 RepID=UPI000DCDB328|nr:MG2 domain-containing protein [Helicobacter sp. 16-1353]RAX55153.1 hypothetical protein CCY99_00185 [Helicobacter sp. 16-1353]